MTDKKSCENCNNFRRVFRKLECTKEHRGISAITCACDDYQRNPRLWLSILPEEPGWYWWRESEKITPIVVEIEKTYNGTLVIGIDFLQPIGQWQGPIRPEEDK